MIEIVIGLVLALLLLAAAARRWYAIEAGARALDANWGDAVWAILDAVEPIIRADERERHGNNCRGMWDEWVHDLRAQVEALESPLHWNDGEDALIYRSQVLALLGGES